MTTQTNTPVARGLHMVDLRALPRPAPERRISVSIEALAYVIVIGFSVFTFALSVLGR